MSKEELSFVHPSIKAIRKSIRDIDDSYSNFWDVLSELLQNSVDAINRKESKTGNIEIEINSLTKTIRVKDDGAGIKSENVPILLGPFSTDKEEEFDSIGEKGVGLKFVMFQSNYFEMKTSYLDSKETSYVILNEARNWKNSNSNEEIKLIREIKYDDFIGTEIVVKDLNQPDLFNLSYEVIKFILRTKTVVGNVLSIFNEEPSVRVNLKMTDINNKIYEEELPYKYWLPTEHEKKDNIVDFDKYILWCEEKKRTEEEKREYIEGKIVVRKKSFQHNDNREILSWSCVLPSRNYWDQISIEDKLVSQEILENKDLKSEYTEIMHQPGIYISVKGMPTGIRIEPPMTGALGYWGNLFIIFEDKTAGFDIGRKVIKGNGSKIYREYAKLLFSEYLSNVLKYIKEELFADEVSDWDKYKVFTEIEKQPKIGSDIIKFQNVPDNQEASVAAIFYELIGNNSINNIIPITTEYKGKYDLYAYLKGKDSSKIVVIEFKSRLRNIKSDFRNYKKLADELDYIVCWDVSSEDIRIFNEDSVEIKEYNIETRPEITHQMIIGSYATPINIIDLKVLLNRLSKK